MSAHPYRTCTNVWSSSLTARLAHRPGLDSGGACWPCSRRPDPDRPAAQPDGRHGLRHAGLAGHPGNLSAAEIALVTAPVNVEVVRHNPHLDRVLTFDRRMWRRPGLLFALSGGVRSFRAEVAFVLSSVSFSVTSAAIALMSGAR